PLQGLVLVAPEPVVDERGLFARTWCGEAFRSAGIAFAPVQSGVSWSAAAYTLRGLHWQAPPHAEAKLVRVTAGAVFDVAGDLRPRPPSRGRWHGVILRAGNPPAVFIPEGFAHGLLTRAEGTEVHYAMNAPYEPGSARGARFADPAFAIDWPAPPAVVSDRDLAWPGWEAGP
ncbi:dTDP-4-dehydrorhamnose 3,5-epimerase family protein, partial [Nostoc sp. NIES-2111]